MCFVKEPLIFKNSSIYLVVCGYKNLICSSDFEKSPLRLVFFGKGYMPDFIEIGKRFKVIRLQKGGSLNLLVGYRLIE